MGSHYKATRFPDDLYQQIEAHRTKGGSKNFSIWIKEAAKMGCVAKLAESLDTIGFFK